MIPPTSEERPKAENVSGDHINNHDDWAIAPPKPYLPERKSIWMNSISKLTSLNTFSLKYFHMVYTYVSVTKIGFLSENNNKQLI